MYSALFFCIVLGLTDAFPSLPDRPARLVPRSPLLEWREVPISWSVAAFPKRREITLHGTAREVHRQLVAMNPSFDKDFMSPLLREEVDGTAATSINASYSGARTPRAKRGFLTPAPGGASHMPGGEWGSQGLTSPDLEVLFNAGAQAWNSGGPGSCGRADCGKVTGLWLCNKGSNQGQRMTLDTWNSMFNSDKSAKASNGYEYVTSYLEDVPDEPDQPAAPSHNGPAGLENLFGRSVKIARNTGMNVCATDYETGARAEKLKRRDIALGQCDVIIIQGDDECRRNQPPWEPVRLEH